MSISVEEIPTGRRLSVNGEMTVCSAADTHTRIQAELHPDSNDEIEVDLSGVIELDTAGLQLMLQLKRGYGERIRFVNHSTAVLRILDLSNLGAKFGDPVVIRPDEQPPMSS